MNSMHGCLKADNRGYVMSSRACAPAHFFLPRPLLLSLCLWWLQFGNTKRKQFDIMFDELHKWVDMYDTAVVPSNVRIQVLLSRCLLLILHCAAEAQ